MKQIIVDAAALVAVADEIEHEGNMLGFSDEESAYDDLGFYLPRIRRAVDALREIVRKAKPAEGVKK